MKICNLNEILQNILVDMEIIMTKIKKYDIIHITKTI